MKLWAWGQSDPGRKRERNEDSYLVDPDTGVLVVADGMGGHQGGATASRMAVELIGKELQDARGKFENGAKALSVRGGLGVRTTAPMEAVDEFGGDTPPSTLPVGPGAAVGAGSPLGPVRGDDPTLPPTGAAAVLSPVLDMMRALARRASAAIFEASWAKPELRGMGTTLTAALVHAGRIHVVHAGDSRCYMFRDGRLRQLTDDHSWIAEQLRAGAISETEAKASKFRHVITKSIGFERDIDADCKSVPVSAGDCFLLCSDGMSNYVEHGELERIVAMTWYRRLPETLIELANTRGGDDNITVVVGLVANV
jgi:protein phosphatase|nr:protein phosphatase 2C domain-containing protein [Kofleriaceae bacterium]